MSSNSEKRQKAWISNLLPLEGMALRSVFRQGYTGSNFKSDVLAGLTVGIIALPLSMALAIASGVAPQYGLYTAIVAGAIAALLGGSRVSVTGPTAAFVVILAPIAEKFGLGGLLTATAMAGGFLILLSIARMGQLIQFIPHPVTTGFTAGIAVVIGTIQIKDFLGLSIQQMPEHFIGRAVAILQALPSTNWHEATIGAVTLGILVLWPRITNRIPAPLVATAIGAALAALLTKLVPGFEVTTISSRFSFEFGGELLHGIPPLPPRPGLPWSFPGPDGQPIALGWGLLRDLSGPAVAIALLGAIESLLCAVAADGMAGTRHDPDAELFAQGVANLVCPFMGGIAATGAIARTTANLRGGAHSPIAAIVHSVFVLLSVVFLAPLLGYLPMASMAALLLVVAWRMSDAKHFVHILKVAPKSDILVLATCFVLTVVFDMVVSVTAGVVLASLLFMRRMAEFTHTTAMGEHHRRNLANDVPDGAIIYEIAGPMFFGAAEKALGSLEKGSSTTKYKVLILMMESVPVMDLTGLVALQTVITRANKAGTFVILVGVQAQPLEVLGKGGVKIIPGKVAYAEDLELALMLANLEISMPGSMSQENVPLPKI